jgi:ATP-dependent helicase/nuclease subunit A
MTVHGAKGLEAPIVILPDTAAPREQIRDTLVPLGEHVVWKTRADESPAAMSGAIDAAKEKQRQERDRLLYVAMTRAETWLIVAGAGDRHDDPQSWHNAVQAAMGHVNGAAHDFAFGEGLRVESGDWSTSSGSEAAASQEDIIVVPKWAAETAPEPAASSTFESPSELGGAKALAGPEGQDEASAKRYGTLVHEALERLSEIPNEARENVPDETEESRAFYEALRVLETPETAALFADNTLAEVAVTAEIEEGRRMHGIIDRLVVGESSVLAVDFKTNAVVPGAPAQVPEGILRQMGAYAAMLAQVYPRHEIQTAILWTRTTELMLLPHDLVTEALGRTTSP